MANVKLFTESEVEARLPMAAAIEAVEASLRALAEGTARNLPRRRIAIPDGAVLHGMEAAVRLPAPDGSAGRWYCGFKIYASSRTGAHFLVGLFAGDSGELLALFEGDRLGQRRTGAATAVATRCLAPAGADRIGLIGAGWQAESQLEGICSVLRIRQIAVASRRPESAAAFASRMSLRLSVPVTAVASAAAAVEGAHIVVTATTASRPVLPDAALGGRVHINAMGANNLRRAELEPATVLRAGRLVVDSVAQCQLEAGDLVQALGDAPAAWSRVEELSAVVAAPPPGRGGGLSIFKFVGLAVWDVAVAARVYEDWKAER